MLPASSYSWFFGDNRPTSLNSPEWNGIRMLLSSCWKWRWVFPTEITACPNLDSIYSAQDKKSEQARVMVFFLLQKKTNKQNTMEPRKWLLCELHVWVLHAFSLSLLWFRRLLAPITSTGRIQMRFVSSIMIQLVAGYTCELSLAAGSSLWTTRWTKFFVWWYPALYPRTRGLLMFLFPLVHERLASNCVRSDFRIMGFLPLQGDIVSFLLDCALKGKCWRQRGDRKIVGEQIGMYKHCRSCPRLVTSRLNVRWASRSAGSGKANSSRWDMGMLSDSGWCRCMYSSHPSAFALGCSCTSGNGRW